MIRESNRDPDIADPPRPMLAFCPGSVFASERLTGALLDRLTHHVHILEMNGDSYRLKQSKHRQRPARAASIPDNPPDE
jgi:IstB-like ATP binding protein